MVYFLNATDKNGLIDIFSRAKRRESSLVSLARLQEIPPKNLILLVGPPGSGKTTFCQQAILQNLAMDRPLIYVTTESDSSEAEKALRERGLGEIEPGLLNFVDAYSETVGVSSSDRSDTVSADCANLSSIGIAISKLEDRIGKIGVLLVFDSLVSPYLLAGQEIIRFMRLTLSKFVAEGNAVLACMDEGCGKPEDLGAMMSTANGVMKMGVEEGKRVLNVVKYPKVESIRIEIPTEKVWREKALDTRFWDREMFTRMFEADRSGKDSREFGFAVNIFWPSITRWSGMLWDPKRFPRTTYEFLVEYASMWRETISMLPWHMKLLFKFLIPTSFSSVKDMKKLVKFLGRMMKQRRFGIMEYLEDISKTDEHYIRVYESFECCGFKDVGAATGVVFPPLLAGTCKGLESWRGLERDWNAVETKCLGLGDPYCEFKLVPGEIDELNASLEKDSSIIERIHENLMNRLMGFLLEGEPLVDRPQLGSDLAYSPESSFPFFVGGRYLMAFRMGGVRAGRMVGNQLMQAGIGGDEAVNRLITLLEHCKVGEVTVGETIRIQGSRESLLVAGAFTEKWEEPCCFYTTAFLNGFFSIVRNQHVKETKCIAMGDPYCEWEFR